MASLSRWKPGNLPPPVQRQHCHAQNKNARRAVRPPPAARPGRPAARDGPPPPLATHPAKGPRCPATRGGGGAGRGGPAGNTAMTGSTAQPMQTRGSPHGGPSPAGPRLSPPHDAGYRAAGPQAAGPEGSQAPSPWQRRAPLSPRAPRPAQPIGFCSGAPA